MRESNSNSRTTADAVSASGGWLTPILRMPPGPRSAVQTMRESAVVIARERSDEAIQAEPQMRRLDCLAAQVIPFVRGKANRTTRLRPKSGSLRRFAQRNCSTIARPRDDDRRGVHHCLHGGARRERHSKSGTMRSVAAGGGREAILEFEGLSRIIAARQSMMCSLSPD